MKPDETRKRVCEIDYLKGILILLMVTFHLVYIEELYPYAKQVVYTFHMPCFLFFSGYLMNTQKDWEGFLRTLGFLLIPYTIMESGYILMASMLSIREAIEELTVTVWIEKLFLHPIGPYWYLQTMVICGLLYYIALRYLHVTPPVSHNHIRHFILLSGNLHWRCQFCKLHVLSCRSCFAAEQCQVPRTVPTISFLCHCIFTLDNDPA